MEIIHSQIQNYISELSKHLCSELEDLEKETYQKVLMPHMISGKEQGVFLYQFISALKPKRVLELGTFTGYSAICMALGMSENTKLTTVDINEEIAYIPAKYFEIMKPKLKSEIEYIIQDGVSFCSSLEENSIDVVFIDADKKSYPKYYEVMKNKLKIGGYLLVDNVLWHGKILDENLSSDTKSIKTMTDMIFSDADFISSIIPLRDGILIAQKCN